MVTSSEIVTVRSQFAKNGIQLQVQNFTVNKKRLRGSSRDLHGANPLTILDFLRPSEFSPIFISRLIGVASEPLFSRNSSSEKMHLALGNLVDRRFNAGRIFDIISLYDPTKRNMDSKSTSAASDHLTAALRNAIIDKAKGNEFGNTAGDIPTIQKPIPITDEDYTAVSDMVSVTLPHELVERVFLLLDIESMLTCRLVNRYFNDIVQSSTILQYSLACKTAGVVDNSQSSLSYAERLEALKRREDAWRKLKPLFEKPIYGFPSQTPNSISRFIEGAYFCSDNDCRYLKYCHLPSSPHDNLEWTEIPSHGPGEGLPRIWVNLETALNEHDLVVNIVSTRNQGDVQRHSLDLIFLKFSTGEYHPLARHPRIHVQRSPDAEPLATCRIAGDNIALIVYSHYGTFSDKLFIFDWKTGHKRLQHNAEENAYRGLVFISPELLLVPNVLLYHFEVWHLPPSHHEASPPIQILSLKIPAISSHYTLFSFSCRGEPNPFLHSTPYIPPRPFFSSPEMSIIVTRVQISSNATYERTSYDIIMHRRALLDAIQKWTSLLHFGPKDLPTWFTNEVTVHKIVDAEDGTVRPEAQSRLVSMKPNSSPRTCDSPHLSDSASTPASSGSSTISSACSFLQVPWAEWGPPISHWIQVNKAQRQRISHSAGQRYVFSDPNPHDRQKLMISVMDFNPYSVRKNAEILTQFRGESKDNGDTSKEEDELAVFDHGGGFSEDVRMGLKFTVYQVPDEYEFDTVWMDEERLLGAKLNLAGWEESIKVLYIG